MFKSVKRTKRDMLAALDCEPTSAKMIGHSTLEYVRPDGIRVIRFHETDVVLIEPDGTVQLFTGGWLTPTTKSRLNDVLPEGFCIYADKGVWWVSNGYGWQADRKQWPFTEGMKVTPDGKVSGVDENVYYRVKELRRKIKKFCDAMKKLNKLPAPTLGDCLLCRLSKNADRDCLESHLDEVYIHGTLVLNAMREFGCPDFIVACAFDPGHSNRTALGSIGRERAIKAVRRYFNRHLGLSI